MSLRDSVNVSSHGNAQGRIVVGTASWSDPGFVKHWYPKGMQAGDRLKWYAQHFEMVEINSTFYSVPEPRMVERWSTATPESFEFDVKLHQLLSRHSTSAKLLPSELQQQAQSDQKGKVKLTPALEEALTRRFLASIEVLRRKGKLGALLLQLSPAFSPKKHKLEELDQLFAATREYQLAVEFRNRDWVLGKQWELTMSFMREQGAAFVNVDAPLANHFTIMPSEIDEITAPQLTYLRLHGRNANAYLTGKTVAARFNYDYTETEIVQVADRSKKLAQRAGKVHVVFNNNALDYAPRAALRLRAALGQLVAGPSEAPELF